MFSATWGCCVHDKVQRFWLPMSVGSARETQHLQWAYYQLLLHLPECPLLLGLIQWGNSAALPLGSVVEVGTACRHGYHFDY